jgi:ABC-type transporter Mla subunit MlaD
VAAIRTVGLASVTNRVVELQPGPPEGAEIADGGVLGPEHTRGIVDLDMLLNAATPEVRKNLQSIIREAAKTVEGDAEQQVNRGLAYLHPALSQVRALGGEVVRDQGALETLVATGAQATGALASREEDLGAGLESAAAALRQVAGEREAFGALLEGAPATLRQADATLRDVADTLPDADPVLRGLRPAVAPLGRVLRTTVPVARDAGPAIDAIRDLLPRAKAILEKVPALEVEASPALDATTKALKDLLPIVAGLRAYGPDFIGGLFNGFGGATGGYYDANGHYLRISLEGAPSSLPGLLPTPEYSLPGNGYRTGITKRCPGAAEEPAPDGSNPWVAEEGLCDPAHDMTVPPEGAR